MGPYTTVLALYKQAAEEELQKEANRQAPKVKGKADVARRVKQTAADAKAKSPAPAEKPAAPAPAEKPAEPAPAAAPAQAATPAEGPKLNIMPDFSQLNVPGAQGSADAMARAVTKKDRGLGLWMAPLRAAGSAVPIGSGMLAYHGLKKALGAVGNKMRPTPTSPGSRPYIVY